MKQTAVEWLEFRYKNNITLNQYDFEEAKEIEKQQIIDANIAGMEFIAVDVNYYNQDAEQYYNETFKKDVK